MREQLERLLQSVHFRNSRRYPALLRYVVEQTLLGRGAGLKERTLGVEVFGRPVDYDTAADPIVRVTIAEVRKRIAQYYHEAAHSQEPRIELNPGSYIPEFLPGRPAEAEQAQPTQQPGTAVAEALPAVAPEAAPQATAEPEGLTRPPVRARFWRYRWWWGGLASAVALLVALLLVLPGTSAMDRLWLPMFAEVGPVTFCLPISIQKNSLGSAATTAQAITHALDIPGQAASAVDGTFFAHQTLGENVVYSDVVAMMKLESVVEAQHRPVRVRLNMTSNLNDFREGPTVFIGGLDNQWTLRLLEPLRYRFAGDDRDKYYIRDSKAPNDKRWSVRLFDKMTVVNHDYAIIARIHSDSLERIVMVVAGIGMSGTAAAGDFLADPAQVRELERRIGYRNRNHDFEAVLQSDVDNGVAGAARIVALDVR